MIAPELLNLLNIGLGASIAMISSIIQIKLNNASQKKKILIDKIERAHLLCQQIYDGHRSEILKAKKYLPTNPEEYLNKREHPGEKTNELKMLIRSYAPNLANHLDEIDKGHVELKKSFRSLDECATRNSLEFSKLNIDSEKWDEWLEHIAKGTRNLKKDLENLLFKTIN